MYMFWPIFLQYAVSIFIRHDEKNQAFILKKWKMVYRDFHRIQSLSVPINLGLFILMQIEWNQDLKIFIKS